MKKKKNKKKEQESYRGLPYDSLEEKYFFMWAYELKDRGYIKSIKRADAFHLSDGLVNNYPLQLKTKSKPMYQPLLQGHVYTPEVHIVWDKKAKDVFFWDIESKTKHGNELVAHKVEDTGEYISYVEVKPPFDFNNMTRLATLNIKWVYQKYHVFVNIVKTHELFARTFTPKEYMITSKGKTRKINWKYKEFNQFIN